MVMAAHEGGAGEGEWFGALWEGEVGCDTRFCVQGFRGWLYKYNKFSETIGTPAHDKVGVAAMHLENQALQRHRIYMKPRFTMEITSWEEYIKEISSKFGNSCENKFATLFKAFSNDKRFETEVHPQVKTNRLLPTLEIEGREEENRSRKILIMVMILEQWIGGF
ncbi:hypothetical protein ACH5RR_025637 [Cinchona calisaya]|uniref:Uncharacterized protein n=1 Tax=Cinchona calisaya TaxID=153742 RepID=A0ABD2Z3K6_9GENT